jgi:hypothetical protein
VHGEVKQFTSENYTMKWYGRKKQKLVIIRDDKNESLREKLIKFATLNKVIIHDGKQYGEAEGNSNMVEVIENSWSDDGNYDSDHTRKYMHAETLALLTKPLYFPNMKYLK